VAVVAGMVAKSAGYQPQSIANSVPKDGSLIFWEGGPLAKIIKRNTGSDLSHAAIVLNGHVYEATWPKVRRVKWAVYVAEMKQHKRQWRNFDWFTAEPKRNFSVPAVLRMLLYAKSQVGKPYMLRGWWQGRETKGLFCSQYVANTLEKSGLIQSANYHESPGSLYEKVKSYYDHR
jgi:hypothetical protein